MWLDPRKCDNLNAVDLEEALFVNPKLAGSPVRSRERINLNFRFIFNKARQVTVVVLFSHRPPGFA